MPFSYSVFIAVALGGASGASLRFVVSSLCMRWWPAAVLPIGTLVVNAVGSLAIGWLFAVFSRQLVDDSFWRPLLITGLLGAFTTFSAFSLEVVQLLQRGDLFVAVVYMLMSVALCVGFAWLGLQFAGYTP